MLLSTVRGQLTPSTAACCCSVSTAFITVITVRVSREALVLEGHSCCCRSVGAGRDVTDGWGGKRPSWRRLGS